MFFRFFDELRSARVPVTLKEYLALMDALSKDVIDLKVDGFTPHPDGIIRPQGLKLLP